MRERRKSMDGGLLEALRRAHKRVDRAWDRAAAKDSELLALFPTEDELGMAEAQQEQREWVNDPKRMDVRDLSPHP